MRAGPPMAEASSSLHQAVLKHIKNVTLTAWPPTPLLHPCNLHAFHFKPAVSGFLAFHAALQRPPPLRWRLTDRWCTQSVPSWSYTVKLASGPGLSCSASSQAWYSPLGETIEDSQSYHRICFSAVSLVYEHCRWGLQFPALVCTPSVTIPRLLIVLY